MKLQIQSIHFDADRKLLDFIQKKLDKLDSFYDRITGGDVYLKVENVDTNNKSVHVKLFIPGSSIMAKENGSSFEEAVDLVLENLKRQLKKQKEKMSQF